MGNILAFAAHRAVRCKSSPLKSGCGFSATIANAGHSNFVISSCYA